jgi:hypothetical protein
MTGTLIWADGYNVTLLIVGKQLTTANCSVFVSVNTVRSMCSLLSPLGGRGKKGGGFATVSSSYKVRLCDPVWSPDLIARYAGPIFQVLLTFLNWYKSPASGIFTDMDLYFPSDKTCSLGIVNYRKTFQKSLLVLHFTSRVGHMINLQRIWDRREGVKIETQFCLIRTEWCTQIYYYLKFLITWPRQPSQNPLWQSLSSLLLMFQMRPVK